MANREKWEFEYPLLEVLEAAKAQADVHREAVSYWNRDYTRADDRPRRWGKQSPEAKESLGRATHHFHMAAQYDRWVHVLAPEAPARELMLTADDVAFFWPIPEKTSVLIPEQ